ncbi:Uncharacterised protein [Mycobacterium tuberculosis]|uniref:Uncharacterized protein n=1 Tax=Mycobacterium tuberculosis TaxID=1773 RepID=A0A916LFE1_MYCTX|nr:Uncharacterised protein [Mycobacterium tuberculosis]CPA21076.1 Uncharacterised protein [Mycobacterium tuberculosis]
MPPNSWTASIATSVAASEEYSLIAEASASVSCLPALSRSMA